MHFTYLLLLEPPVDKYSAEKGASLNAEKMAMLGDSLAEEQTLCRQSSSSLENTVIKVLTTVTAYLQRKLGPFGLAYFVSFLEIRVPVLSALHPVGLQQNTAINNAKTQCTRFNGLMLK